MSSSKTPGSQQLFAELERLRSSVIERERYSSRDSIDAVLERCLSRDVSCTSISLNVRGSLSVSDKEDTRVVAVEIKR